MADRPHKTASTEPGGKDSEGKGVGYLVLSGEGSGLRGGGVRGTAGLGAMEAEGIKP